MRISRFIGECHQLILNIKGLNEMQPNAYNTSSIKR